MIKFVFFQPHRISRLKDLKEEFTYAFKNADLVILCPIFTAGEKIKLGFSYESFAKEIVKNSKVKLFMVENYFQLAKFLKREYVWKKNCSWHGSWFNFQLDERITKVNVMEKD